VRWLAKAGQGPRILALAHPDGCSCHRCRHTAHLERRLGRLLADHRRRFSSLLALVFVKYILRGRPEDRE